MAHFNGDLKGEAPKEPEAVLLPLLRDTWATRGIVTWGRGCFCGANAGLGRRRRFGDPKSVCLLGGPAPGSLGVVGEGFDWLEPVGKRRHVLKEAFCTKYVVTVPSVPRTQSTLHPLQSVGVSKHDQPTL